MAATGIFERIEGVCGLAFRGLGKILSLLTFSAADVSLRPKKVLSVSIEKGAAGAALGRGLLFHVNVTDEKRLEIMEKAYPGPDDLVLAAKSVIEKAKGWDRCNATLVIPWEWVIQRDSEFPASAGNDISNAISYNMDRLVPFGVDRIFYDWQVIRDNGKKLTVRVSAVKLEKVKPYIDQLGENGITVTNVICADENQTGVSPAKWGITGTIGPKGRSDSRVPGSKRPNLLNKGRRERHETPVAGTALLIVLCMAVWIYHSIRPIGMESEKIETLNRQVSFEKKKAAGGEGIVRQIGVLNDEIAAIKDFDLGRPAAIRTLKELTAIIPKSAWLTGLKFTGDSVQIEGYAASSTGLIPRLERSGYFKKAEFASATVRDAAMKADHFIIKMELAQAAPGGRKKSAPGKNRASR